MARNCVVVVVGANMFKGQVSVLPLQMDVDLSLTIAVTYNLGTSLTCAYSVNLWSLSSAVQVSSWSSKLYGPRAVIDNLFSVAVAIVN